MIRNWILLVIGILIVSMEVHGQSYWFGPSGGLTLGTQRWNNYEKRAALLFHGGAFIETYDAENLDNALYAYAGYHQRGSSLRVLYRNPFNNFTNWGKEKFAFNNIILKVGIKKLFKKESNLRLYYTFGLRGEYNVSTNLDKFDPVYQFYFPQEAFVKKFTGGINLGVGYDFNFSELYGGFIQFSIDPDFFPQYDAPEIPNVINPNNPGNPTTIRAQRINNLSFEITFGMKFLRKVEYIDE